MKKIKITTRRKKLILTKSNNLGTDEVYCDWYICPNQKCESGDLRHGDNFCANCGKPLDWSMV